MTAATLSYTIDAVIARLRELAQNGHAPGVRAWNRQRGPDLPIYETLSAHGHNWLDLCELAGLEPAKRGGPPGSPGRIVSFEAADAEVRHRLATAEPPRPAEWPLFGIPTKTETFVVAITDDTAVRCTRQYFSLR